MKKELVLIVASILIIAGIVSLAKKPEQTGFDGPLNKHARVYHDWFVDDYVWLTAKWSKDWKWDGMLAPNATETKVGAWFKFNLEWYTENLYPFDDLVMWDGDEEPIANYSDLAYFKIMKVGNNSEAWEDYKGEAIPVFTDYGYYDVNGNGSWDPDEDVPMFILFQGHFEISEGMWSVVGSWTLTNYYAFQEFDHDVTITTQDEYGDFEGTGHYAPGPFDWTCTGYVDGLTFNMTIDYISGYHLWYDGTINPANGNISGVWISDIPDVSPNGVQDGAFTTSEGAAHWDYFKLGEFDFIGIPPFGLGQPLFE